MSYLYNNAPEELKEERYRIMITHLKPSWTKSEEVEAVNLVNQVLELGHGESNGIHHFGFELGTYSSFAAMTSKTDVTIDGKVVEYIALTCWDCVLFGLKFGDRIEHHFLNREALGLVQNKITH